jgi:hypothetical protein
MSTPVTPTQAALNATPATVLYQDGREEEISVAQLPIIDLYKFIDGIALDDVPKVVALCCGRDLAWVNTLTPKSYGKLSKLTIEQNFPPAMEIIQSDPIAAAKCSKLLALLDEASVTLLKNSASLSAAPASSASVEESLPAS